MARTSFCLPVALAYLFLASVVPSNAQNVAPEEEHVSVEAGAPLDVRCRLRPEQRAQWRLDGAPPPPDLRAAPEAAAPDGRLTARLHAAAARPHHAGLYTCSADPLGPRVLVDVRPSGSAATSASDTDAAAGEEAAPRETLYDVRLTLALNCSLANPSGLPYQWKKNDTDIEKLSDLAGRYRLERDGAELAVAHSTEDDWGNYSCAAAGAEQRWTVRARAFVKLPANSNVVEGQKLKLQCKVLGKPYPRVVWTFSNSSEEGANGTEVRAVFGERVTLKASEQGAEDGELLLEAVQRADAGHYACAAPVAGAAANMAFTKLHVKDMYAALWPFLGICAEVFVLCAIILVYEKRRTKPDVDDSDTDNHDQKKS